MRLPLLYMFQTVTAGDPFGSDKLWQVYWFDGTEAELRARIRQQEPRHEKLELYAYQCKGCVEGELLERVIRAQFHEYREFDDQYVFPDRGVVEEVMRTLKRVAENGGTFVELFRMNRRRATRYL